MHGTKLQCSRCHPQRLARQRKRRALLPDSVRRERNERAAAQRTGARGMGRACLVCGAVSTRKNKNGCVSGIFFADRMPRERRRHRKHRCPDEIAADVCLRFLDQLARDDYRREGAWKRNARYRSGEERKPKSEWAIIRQRIAVRVRKAVLRRLAGEADPWGPGRDRSPKYDAIFRHIGPCPGPLSEWHIDHIRPLASFNLLDPDEYAQAIAPENHQWLPARENLEKNALWEGVNHRPSMQGGD